MEHCHHILCISGEILSCEKFFSFGVPPDGNISVDYETKSTTHTSWEESIIGRYDHCSHCGKKCKALIPCPSCTVVRTINGQVLAYLLLMSRYREFENSIDLTLKTKRLIV